MRQQQISLLILAICITTSAHAYVDPGSSLLLLQGVFAIVGAALVFVRHPIIAIKRLLARLNKMISKQAE